MGKTQNKLFSKNTNMQYCFGRKYKWYYFWKNTEQKDLCILDKTQTQAELFWRKTQKFLYLEKYKKNRRNYFEQKHKAG